MRLPELSRPFRPSEARVVGVLGDHRLADGWITIPDLLAALVEADAYGIDLDPEGVIRVLANLIELGVVEPSTGSYSCYRVIDLDRPVPDPVVEAKYKRSRKATETFAAAKAAKTSPITTQAEDQTMFKRKTTPTPTPVPMNQLLIEEKRQALREKVYGPGHTARAAVAAEPLLAARLEAALADGMGHLELTTIPAYRRPAAVEDALDLWEKAREGGPCAWCGCATPRPGRSILRAVDATTTPSWALWKGTPACAWCRDALGEGGETRLRGLVFRAAASVRSSTLAERWELAPWVTWWSDLTPEQQQTARATGQGPWTQVNTTEARTLARDLLIAPSEFAHTDGAADQVSVPGLRAVPWTREELPQPGPQKNVILMGPRGRAHHAGDAAWFARKAREDAAREAQDLEDARLMRERDARLEAMTESERDKLAAEEHAWFASQQARRAAP